ncbi:GspE/PulE family protein [Tenacibaculum maritimum]|uniref:GspE/PulE family protein n=1 Tax=Tenacibaculum maritimum TaxID=107401 RepID=UPI001E469DF7|nr:GspE/PulE family protein [Tenacibaculum maritimum]
MITKELAWYYRAVPEKENNEEILFFVDEEKDQKQIIKELSVFLGKKVKVISKKTSEIEKLLILKYRTSSEEAEKKIKVGILEEIMYEAIDFKSSDVHFEIYENYMRVRYRIDGVLIEKRKIKKELYLEIVNVIKIQSNLDITEKRLPQDGRTSIAGYDVRVSILPTQFGEKVVMRILGKSADTLELSVLGFEEEELKRYKEAVQKSNGIILISGPTGSGKTTTLYATLKMLNNVEKNIMTVEDPIEYVLEGVNQVQLNEEVGVTFSSTLRSFLRQDPDIIMLGEIRDRKTSEMAIRASLTGHLVLSTIHTNSALGTISRLIDMGVPPFLLSETLNLTLAQRLLRKLCSHCKKEDFFKRESFPSTYQIPREIKKYYKAVGCEKCHYTGYKGRKAIYELVVIDSYIAEEINKKERDFSKLLKRRNIKTLSEKAFELLEKGETSLKEIYSILVNTY